MPSTIQPPTLLIGFANIEAARAALANGGICISGMTVSSNPDALSWPTTEGDTGVTQLLVDARAWSTDVSEVVGWHDVDRSVVSQTQYAKIELYIMVNSMAQLPIVLRPCFGRIICTQSACAALAPPAGDEEWIWLDLINNTFDIHFALAPESEDESLARP